MPRYLHLAASRLERLSREATSILCRPGWIHLGEPPIDWQAEIREQLKFGHYTGALRLLLAKWYRGMKPRYSPEELSQLYASCEFREFYFKAGQQLDLPAGEFSFIVSEHFFEHLFLQDAMALLRECHRLLKPGGVIRTSVPDADLRTYAPVEKAGYPSVKAPWAHHQKHRTRWSVYSLSEALSLAGFKPRPLMYCTAEGEFMEKVPGIGDADYPLEEGREYVQTTAYLRRMPSLVVDGIKP